MPTNTALKKLDEIVAGLLRGQTFYASIGTVSNDTLWSQVASTLLNGNTLLIAPGAINTQIIAKASSMLVDADMYGLVRLYVAVDQVLNTAVDVPVGARTDGTNYYFSEHDPWNETVVFLGGRYSHLYVTHDPLKGTASALGCISTPTPDEPSASLVQTYLSNGLAASPRQAFTQVDASGRVQFLRTFPAMVSSLVSVPQDAEPSAITWTKVISGQVTNALQVQFTFAPGVGTGAVGEIAVKLGTDIIAYLPITPQILKDADIPLTLKWSLMVGDPGAF